MDINMPREKETGKPKGFAFLMYEDQRSTILAVDNMNGAKVLERTLRVDHVKNYRQPKSKGEDGEWIEPEEETFNARPEVVQDEDPGSESSESSGPEIDPEDPMRDYLIQKRREEKALKTKKKSKSKGKHKDETPEERRVRKERKREKKERKKLKKSEGVKGVEALLESLGGRNDKRSSAQSRSPPRRDPRSTSPPRRGFRPRSRSPPRRDHHSRSRSPVRRQGGSQLDYGGLADDHRDRRSHRRTKD
ncbi:hypothetical protein E1B28_004758 [Marasmius oreades]|nr:uncharacterized protein E1B28_004758 [Marasmius oreades]KAG7097411.1 hypothetical protein E1B28_004758 [Marasmius oreades]